jgi:hypothetical protein
MANYVAQHMARTEQAHDRPTIAEHIAEDMAPNFDRKHTGGAWYFHGWLMRLFLALLPPFVFVNFVLLGVLTLLGAVVTAVELHVASREYWHFFPVGKTALLLFCPRKFHEPVCATLLRKMEGISLPPPP